MSAPLPDEPAREQISGALGQTLFVEAGAGSGKTKSLVDRVLALVRSGVAMRHIATITFTEKAAVELQSRVRAELEHVAADPDVAPAERDACAAALEDVDAAAITTLHGFAQRLLTEHALQAGLPPDVSVLDEVGSAVEFDDRWTRFRDRLLDDRALERCLLLAFAAGVDVGDLRRIAAVFGDNWDLIADPARLPWARAEPPRVQVAPFVSRIEALVARRAECREPETDKLACYLRDEIAAYLERLRGAPDEHEALRLLAADKPTFRPPGGKKDHWEDKDDVVAELRAIGEDKRAHVDDVGTACLRRLALEIAHFTLQAAGERRRRGRLEFHDLLVLARDLLRGSHGEAVRARLRARYRHLLLDEFQDTDPIQIELAVLLASPDPVGDKPWPDLPVDPGRLFFVGDPKQSIYRFRRADIALYLAARDRFADPPVELVTNFRSTPPVIDWVNHIFDRLIAHRPDSQPAYQPLSAAPDRAAPPDGAAVVRLGVESHSADGLDADTLREREAADVAEAVRTALGWRVSRRGESEAERWEPATLGDIAILLPARTSLPALERALDARGIPYRAETSSLVYTTREVRDLLLVARALADTSDHLALVAALRSAVFGCGDDDLYDYKVRHGGSWSLHAEPPGSVAADHPVAEALAELRALHTELAWHTPAELLDRIARDRRLFELGYADGRPRDLWRRLRFVIDQARAWSEAEGGTLRDYLAWARLQAGDQARVVESVLPETDDDAVRIMTIHAAKGLEFPITILSGMTTRARGRATRVKVGFPPEGPVALEVGKAVTTPEFEHYAPVDEQMDFDERLRLLYVACTRAVDHLVVSLHRKERESEPDDLSRLTAAELFARASDDAPHQLDLAPRAGPAPTPPARPAAAEPLPDVTAWAAEREAALAASSRRRTLGASDVPVGTGDDETASGAAKHPRDLELAPWQKGRYGHAVGRAVHAVLQTVDLATGEGLEQAAAAQAAAEGVIGREAEIAALAGAALDAPAVRASRSWARWRETYVAASEGGRVLEGYIDLLYRTDAGLVIVDYKTASAGADLEARVAAYRGQGAAYAVAVEGAAGEPVARVAFVFLTPHGPVERELGDLAAATAEVRAVLREHGADH